MPRKMLKPREQIEQENVDLSTRLAQAEGLLDEIRAGRTDALIVQGELGKQLYSRQGAERAYRVFVEAMTEGALTATNDGMILYCNRRFAEMLHLAINQVIGSFIAAYISPDAHSTLQTFLQIGTQRECHHDFTLVHRDGGALYVQFSASPLELDGQTTGLCIIATDLTERKRLEQTLEDERHSLAQRVQDRTIELARANTELARANHLKDDFLSSTSHELRTPLNAIIALSESLCAGVYGTLDPHQNEALGLVMESGYHLLDLINDILDLSKIEAGKLEIQAITTPVEPICEMALRMIKQQAEQKKLVVAFSMASQIDVIRADERRLKQMLVNLLSNAVKFTPQGGKIGLQVKLEGAGAIRFTVWDTGIGIAPDNLGRLFQPFVQIDSALSRQYPGTGLGLVLVRQLAEMHGGSVGVESQVGQGSRFYFTLPMNVPSAR
jgi:PAS domain S-box-containing protein